MAEIQHKHDKQLTHAINNAVYTINSLNSAQAAATLAVLQALEIENMRFQLDVEMASRKHDGKSVKAAIIIQCMLRMRLSRKILAKKRGEEEDSDDDWKKRPKSSKSRRNSKKYQSDSDDDEDEERYRKKIKKRKKRQEKREERKAKQIEYEKRRALALADQNNNNIDSLSEFEGDTSESGLEGDKDQRALVVKKKGLLLNDSNIEELPPFLGDASDLPGGNKMKEDSGGPPILPGKISDNPILYGDEKEAGEALNIFNRMFKRQGADPRTYNPASIIPKRNTRTPPILSNNNTLTIKSMKEEQGEGSGSDGGGGGGAGTVVPRAGGLMGRLGNRMGAGGGGDSSDDADESSGDENAFATKVFASMGSTAKIVPLNRNMIRAEADNAMDEKLSGLLDAKLK